MPPVKSFAAIATVALPLAALFAPLAANADTTLPNPYVSRALDAVLLPINADVHSAFALAGSDAGVLVIAVADGGVADAYGIEPGDILSDIKGKKITQPIDVDTYVYYWISTGTFDLVFDYYRNGVIGSATTTMSEALYSEEIDIVSVESWQSWSVEGFSYSEFYSEYSEVMVEEYSSSESMIEETVTSEEFTSEVTEESSEATEATDDTADDAATDDAMADDTGGDDAMADDAAADDAMADDAGADDAAADDAMADDAGGDDAAADDAGADDAGGDDAGGDDSAGEDTGGDE